MSRTFVAIGKTIDWKKSGTPKPSNPIVPLMGLI
jgi:hypothetical protein